MIRITFFLVVLAVGVQSLKYQDVEEGSCPTFEPTDKLNDAWFASAPFRYISAGNKYNLYRMASSHPRFSQLRDYEFYYQSCLQCFYNNTAGEAFLYGFGDGIINNYLIRTPPKQQDNVMDFVSLPTPGLKDIIRHHITLTDNRSFVFFANCWMGSDQRGWVVVSTTPSVDEDTQKMIEEHAASLGFEKEMFVFLNHDSCDNPVPGNIETDYRRRRISAAALEERRLRREERD